MNLHLYANSSESSPGLRPLLWLGLIYTFALVPASAYGAATASPSSVTWGSVAVGSAGGQKVATLTNNGTASINISSIGFTGTNAIDFQVFSRTCGTTLPASGSCTANIIFKPTSAGTRTATLNFSDSASGSPQQIAVSGLATGGSASGTVTVSPSTLSFGTLKIGTTSVAQAITIKNGTASSVAVGAGSLGGSNKSEFTISSTTCTSTLAASKSCVSNIVFKPSIAGAASATFNVIVAGASYAVSLSGTGSTTGGGGGTVTPSPTTMNFGPYPVNSTSNTHLVTLSNSGSAITVSSVTVTGPNAADFPITRNQCKGTPPTPSQPCNTDLIFAPSATGTRTATLVFTDTASNSPQTVALSGTGTPPPTTTFTISPSAQAWGSQGVNSTAATKTFTITASGSGSANFTSITSTDPADFSISNNCGSSLAAGHSCTATVSFKPTAIGNRVGLLTLVDTAIGGTQSAAVSGVGTYSGAQKADVTVDLGSRSGTGVPIPADIMGTEYFESLPSDANRAFLVQGGFTSVRYRLQVDTIFPGTTISAPPSWGALDSDMRGFQKANVHPIAEVEGTPKFLQPKTAPCNMSTGVPTDPAQWGKLVQQIIAHLDHTFPGTQGNPPFVQDYEVWNEPNTTSLCPHDFQSYMNIYAGAAPLMKAQLKTDGNTTARVGGAAAAGVGYLNLLTTTNTAPYVDFYSYHIYEGSSTDIKNGMTWSGAGGTPSLYAKLMDSTPTSASPYGSGLMGRYLQAYAGVKIAKTPMGAKTPIYFDEYNDDWAFLPDCCRNSPTYSPLFNSLLVAQMFNAVYHGAGEVPAKLIYFSADQQTFCLLGIVNSSMNCNRPATGAQAQPYPQYFTYEMIFGRNFLDLQDAGHMANSVAYSGGLVATAFYTASTDSALIINPTSSHFSPVTLQINNPGFSTTSTRLYMINANNPNPAISNWPASSIAVSGGMQVTFDVPPYSVIGIAVK